MRRWPGGILKHKAKVTLGLFWLALFLSGLYHYAGSKFVFVIFSVVYAAMLLSGIRRRVSYGYLFLVLFLWLGFWFKLSANFLLLGFFPFGEPVGNFDSSVGAWDQVLWIAIGGAVGVMLGRFLYGLFGQKYSPKIGRAKTPAWYPANRKWLWTGVLLLTVGLAVFNVFQGIHQIGINPRTILHWPLNALIAWMLNLGLALAIAVLIWWDVATQENITLPLYVMLAEAFFSTVSILSRSVFLFHAVPQMVALRAGTEIFQRYSKKQIFLFGVIFVALFLIAITAVSFLRDYQYAASRSAPTPPPKAVTDSVISGIQTVPAEPIAETRSNTPSFRPILVHQLVINRWIGLEGVMAISSYPEKNDGLFWEMLREKRDVGKVSAYQKISNSGYQTSDASYQFASLPGATAFFFYSGSILMVILGMAGLSLLIISVETIVFKLTENPLICSLFGATAANTVAQFGVAPRQDIPYFVLIISSAILIYFLQSDKLAAIITSFNLPLSNKQ